MANDYSEPLVSSDQSCFVSIGRASKILGCSIQVLRLWESEGKIKAYRTVGKHRRFRISEIQAQALGVSKGETGKKIALYVRVSHVSQKSHLAGQRLRLIEEVCEREGCNESDLLIFEEIASSFGNRPKLNKLIDAMLESKVTKLYAENFDRLSRVASLSRLIEYLARKNNVEIVALDRDQDEDSMKANLAELVEFVHVISCRTIARRTAERRKKKLHPETVAELEKMLNSGHGIKDSVRLLNLKGHRTVDGKKISYRVGHNYSKSLAMATYAQQKEKAINHTFARFAGECIKTNKGNRVQSGAIYEAYCDWCKKNKVETVLQKRKCADWLVQEYKRENKCGYSWYLDITLDEKYPNVINGKGLNAQLANQNKKPKT